MRLIGRAGKDIYSGSYRTILPAKLSNQAAHEIIELLFVGFCFLYFVCSFVCLFVLTDEVYFLAFTIVIQWIFV